MAPESPLESGVKYRTTRPYRPGCQLSEGFLIGNSTGNFIRIVETQQALKESKPRAKTYLHARHW